MNALLTLPFWLLALVVPEFMFAQFGLQLDAAGALIARGYAATLIGYGLVLWLNRNTGNPLIAGSFLLSMTAFNVIETLIQGIAGFQGIASAIIFGNVIIHGGVAGACVATFLKLKKRQS